MQPCCASAVDAARLGFSRFRKLSRLHGPKPWHWTQRPRSPTQAHVLFSSSTTQNTASGMHAHRPQPANANCPGASKPQTEFKCKTSKTFDSFFRDFSANSFAQFWTGVRPFTGSVRPPTKTATVRAVSTKDSIVAVRCAGVPIFAWPIFSSEDLQSGSVTGPWPLPAQVQPRTVTEGSS